MSGHTKWTPGPMLTVGSTIYALDESNTVNRVWAGVQPGYVFGVGRRNFPGRPDERTSEEECEATADRLAVCWNALANIPDPAAHMQAAQGVVEAAESLHRAINDPAGFSLSAVKAASEKLHTALTRYRETQAAALTASDAEAG